MKKNIIIITLSILLIITCFFAIRNNQNNKQIENNAEIKNNQVENNEETKSKQTIIKSEEYDILEKVSQAVFYYKNDLESLKLEDIEPYKKVYIAYKLSNDSLNGNTLKETYKKYFNGELELVDIPCDMDNHDILYIYNGTKGEYEYNQNHGGHGGRTLNTKILFDELKLDENNYYFTAYVAQYIPKVKQIGDFTIYNKINGKVIFESNESAVEKGICYYEDEVANDNITIYKDIKCDEEKAFESIKDKLTKYTFEFEKIDGKLVFKSYYINK